MKVIFESGTNRLLTFLLMTLLSIGSFSCGNKSNEGGNAQMISGSTSKVWKANKETNSVGDKEKLSKAEKQEQIQFFSNGNFTQTSATQSDNGTWTYDPQTKTLSLTYANNSVSENFSVTELDEDNLKLQAPDGSTLELEAQ
ncbi:lipocalin-like domain-containing protein [Rufibacter roseus]|uniref:Lipocalin-like domain-containing protein n=1 Tax=Rufibacter roseus TaxID=1567108 RepID=A0ABW2DLE8_9BACT|nr:DUF4923 family protein [Rufibacter roseus]